LLLRDLGREDAQIDAIVAIIEHINPHVLLLTDFDYDRDQLALSAFAARLGFAHMFAALPNTGMATGMDLDQNGYLGDARDAQGYGRFSGDGGMAILSDWPLALEEDFNQLLWRDLDGATLPPMPDEIADIQRLSTSAHWIVEVAHPQPFNLWTFSATPPVFDGPEDRNGLRNRDELRLWSQIMDRDAPRDFIIMGNANLDPLDGDGLRDAMQSFLDDPRIQDPRPTSNGGIAAADPDHFGDPALDTADWPDNKPGNLRVSYVLPSADMTTSGAGVFWPAPDDPDVAWWISSGSPANMTVSIGVGWKSGNRRLNVSAPIQWSMSYMYRISRISRATSTKGDTAAISHQGKADRRKSRPVRAFNVATRSRSVKVCPGNGTSANSSSSARFSAKATAARAQSGT